MSLRYEFFPLPFGRLRTCLAREGGQGARGIVETVFSTLLDTVEKDHNGYLTIGIIPDFSDTLELRLAFP